MMEWDAGRKMEEKRIQILKLISKWIALFG
jgi:hypothetical protein